VSLSESFRTSEKNAPHRLWIWLRKTRRLRTRIDSSGKTEIFIQLLETYVAATCVLVLEGNVNKHCDLSLNTKRSKFPLTLVNQLTAHSMTLKLSSQVGKPVYLQ